ncbi:hypothetical protein K402DRAFT_319757, partial [Aulographum hederae CBS 113979]
PPGRNTEMLRILTILPAADLTAPVQCTLQQHAFADDPLYTALSYAWGDAKETQTIICNGASLQIRTSLEVALRHLRYAEKSVSVWADAVCINQGDVEERNAQVSVMRDVHSKSLDTVVWSGEASADSDAAIDLLDEL